MPSIPPHPRFAHTPGRTHLAFNSSGTHILTGGTDGLLRLFSLEDLDDPLTLEKHDDAVTWIVSTTDRFYSCSEDRTVLSWGQGGSFEGILSRCTLPPQSLDVSRDGLLLAIAGDEMGIRLINSVDRAHVHTLKGHTRSVSHAVFDPQGDFLASISEDGALRIWEISQANPVCVKNFAQFVQGTRLSLSWSFDGKYLAVSGARDIRIIERNTWQIAYTLRDEHKEIVKLVGFHPTGEYLASVSGNQALVWDMRARESLDKWKGEAEVSGISWGKGTLAICDVEGQLGLWRDVVLLSTGKKGEKSLELFPEEEKRKKRKDEELEEIIDSGDDLDALEDYDEEAERRAIELEDSELIEEDVPKKSSGMVTNLYDFSSLHHLPRAMVEYYTHPFQPHSTPFHPALCKRYLSWNRLGMITCTEESAHQYMEIEFHDRSLSRPINFIDHYRFASAVLCEDAALFANTESSKESSRIHIPPRPKKEEKHDSSTASTSVLFYKALGSHPWGSQADWTLHLPSTEQIECIAMSKERIFVTTNQIHLYILSPSGLQLGIIALTDHAICLSAQNTACFGIYRPHMQDGICYRWFEFNENGYHEGSLMTRPGHLVTFVGWMETVPIVADSRGYVMGLVHGVLDGHRHGSSYWQPLCDLSTRDNPSPFIFIISVSSVTQEIMSIECKHDWYPHVSIPRSLPVVHPLIFPFMNVRVRNESPRTVPEWEEYSARCEWMSHLTGEVKFIAQKEAAMLRMLQASITSHKPMRICDIYQRLKMKKSREIAMQLANRGKMESVVTWMLSQNELIESQEYTPHIQQNRSTENPSHVTSIVDSTARKSTLHLSHSVGFQSHSSPHNEDMDTENENENENGVKNTGPLPSSNTPFLNIDHEKGEIPNQVQKKIKKNPFIVNKNK